MKTSEEKIKKALDTLIKEVRPMIFTNPEHGTNDEILGIIISKYVEWNGNRIEEVAKFAFEDSNFSNVEIIIN